MQNEEEYQLELQIREARKRAENFQQSLDEARKREALALEALEKERIQWTSTHENQKANFEQIERQLEVTMDALQAEKSNKSYILDTSTDITSKIATSLLEPQIRRSKEFTLNNLSQSTENMKLIQELSLKREENNNLNKKLEKYESEIKQLSETKEKLHILLKDSDGKLQFRTAQVINLEDDKDKLIKHESELKNLIISLENQIKLNKNELLLLSSELKTSINHSNNLEKEILDNHIIKSDHISNQTQSQTKIQDLEVYCHSLEERSENTHIFLFELRTKYIFLLLCLLKGLLRAIFSIISSYNLSL